MPNDAADPLLAAALRHHAAGQSDEAASAYRQVLARDRDQPVALRGLALIAHATGDNAAAADLLGRCVARDAFNARYWFEYGVVLREVGRLGDAVDAFTRALYLPQDAKQTAQTLADLRQTFRRQGANDAAVAVLSRYVAAHPRQSAGLYHLGQALLSAGEYEQGIDVLRNCLRIEPRNRPAFRSVADGLIFQGRYAEAAGFARAAAEADPNHADAWAYLGKALQRLTYFVAAEESLRRAISLDPTLAAAHNFLGVTLADVGRVDEAIAAYAEAVRLRPDYADALTNLGLAHSYAGLPEPALAAYRKAMTADPDYAEVWGPYLMALNRTTATAPPDVADAYRAWGRKYADPLTAQSAPHTNDPNPSRPLRIGYLSPDFRGHSVAYFIEPILAHHDRTQFEVFCYANVKAPDAVTDRLRAYGHTWRDVTRLSDAQIADQVRADRIDLLIDLAGHTTDHRLLVMARRPAPVQITYLGYPNTTGVAAIDYRLTDNIADPPGITDPLHVETLHRLPGCFLCYRPPDDAPPPTRDASTPPTFTFGSFNSLSKVTPAVLHLWARVLAAAPNTRLIIKSKGADGDVPRRTVTEILSAHQIDPARVELIGKQPTTAEHLGAYRRVDVALDTYPYNGTTTTCEALWMGVPVVTLAGPTHAARVGATLLTAVGLGDLVAADADEYVRLAAALVADPPRVAALRQNMRDRLRVSPLLDTLRFTAVLEAAYRSMWQTWCMRRSTKLAKGTATRTAL